MAKPYYYNYQPTEIAKAAPPMSVDEYRELREDIRVHGLREPVVLLGRQILDGVHRLRACIELEIKPSFTQWQPQVHGDTTDTPIAFAASKHTRRHLTEGQKAVYAARLATLKRGRPGTNPPIGGISQSKAAAIMGAKLRSVQRAKVVVDAGIEPLTDLCASGKLSLDAASKFAGMPESKAIHTTKAEKEQVAARGPKAVRDHLRTIESNKLNRQRLAAHGQVTFLPLTPEQQRIDDEAVDAWFHDRPIEAAAAKLHARQSIMMARVVSHVVQVKDWCERLPQLSHDQARLLEAAWKAAYAAAAKKLGSELDGSKAQPRRAISPPAGNSHRHRPTHPTVDSG